MAAKDKPKSVELTFEQGYSERYDWLRKQHKDWAFSFYASFMYCREDDPIMQEVHHKAIAAFDGIAPTYHIELYDEPTLVWDFHSLLLMVQMMFSHMLTDNEKPLRSCKHCTMAFVKRHPKAAFCNPVCKNRHNVYLNRIRGKS